MTRAALEALMDDGYTIEEAAAELGIPEQQARLQLMPPLEAHQRPRADANGHGGPDAAAGSPGPSGPLERALRRRSGQFRRKPRTKEAMEREARRAEARLLALPRGRRVELLAEAMAVTRGEVLSPLPDAQRRAYLTLADLALEAVELLLESQRDPILLKGDH